MTSFAEKIVNCQGCRCDFYNKSGTSATGECWHLKDARKVMMTQVGIWQEPPYKWQPVETYHCHQPEGFAWIKKDDPRIEKEVS